MSRLCACTNFSLLVDKNNFVWALSSAVTKDVLLKDFVETTSNPNSWKSATLMDIESICCSDNHIFCLDHHGNVWVVGNFMTLRASIPTQIPDLMNIRSISCGEKHALFLDDNDQVWSGGDNFFGQLGVSHSFPVNKIQKVNHKNNITSIYCSTETSYILDVSGKVFVCGRNNEGTFGSKTLPYSASFLLIDVPDVITFISCSTCYSLLITDTGDIWRVGINRSLRELEKLTFEQKFYFAVSYNRFSFVKDIDGKFWVLDQGTDLIFSNSKYLPESITNLNIISISGSTFGCNFLACDDNNNIWSWTSDGNVKNITDKVPPLLGVHSKAKSARK